MPNTCPFINTKKRCTFEKEYGYMCPIVDGDDLECYDLPDKEFEKMQRYKDAKR